jgi:hypothetical protein
MGEPASQEDIRRLEGKLSDISMDLKKLIVVEERQLAQGQRIGTLEQRLAADEALTAKLDRQLSSWINRGIGVWSLAVAIFAIISAPSVIALLRK